HVLLVVPVAAGQPVIWPTVGLPPPCQVQKLLSVPLLAVVSSVCLSGSVVTTLIELNTRQTPTWQPPQATGPTVFELFTWKMNAKSSWPAARSVRFAGGTAVADTTRAVFGPRWPML